MKSQLKRSCRDRTTLETLTSVLRLSRNQYSQVLNENEHSHGEVLDLHEICFSVNVY